MINYISIDTSVLINLISGTGNYSLDSYKIIISRIVYLEFISYKYFSEADLIKIKSDLNNSFEIIELSEDLADIAAFYRRRLKSLKLSDSVVLATAIGLGVDLVTEDAKLKNYFLKIKSSSLFN